MSTNVIVRPATADDLAAFSDMVGKPTTRAWCGELDGKIIALGGLAYGKGRWFAFLDLKPEARRFKVAIAKAARRVLDEARRDGIKFIYAEVSPIEPNALAWLTRLGFKIDHRSQYLYRWSKD